MNKKIRFYLSPYFLSKYYIYRSIKKTLEDYVFDGKIFDFGCGEKPYKNLFTSSIKYEGIDFQNYSINKDYVGEVPDFYFDENYLKNFILPFPSENYDHSVAFQVLEHHQNPQKMITELVRVTKKNGYILITVPFLGGLHEEPHDYQRFTKYGLMELFKLNNCKVLQITEQGSLFSTITMLINEYINNLVAKRGISCVIGLIMYAPMFFFQYLCLLLDKIFTTNKICINYLILVKKNN